MTRRFPVVLLSYAAFVGLVALFLLPGTTYLKDIFSTEGFDPHGHCFLWMPEILRLYVISDTLIGTSYIAISAMLVYLVYRTYPNIPFPRIFLAFGAFIVTCGITHFMDIWTLWNPTYWLSGYAKFITAVASTATAVMLPPLIPRVKALIAAAQKSKERKKSLEEVNRRLEQEIAENERLVAALRENEAQMRNALTKERELNDLKSRIITTISHEFRTPMTIIQTSTELMTLYADRLTDEKRAERLNLIRQEIKNMAGLLDDMTTIGRIQAGKQEIDRRPLDLEMFCRKLVEDLRLMARTHQIEFMQMGNCGTVLLDKRLLNQMLTNLLTNAVKYSPQGGVIQFEVFCKENTVMFRVSDEGIGIPESDQAQVFEAFHRGSNVGVISGTGMGLAIVKNAVELHDGTLHLESEAGKGTTITARLPLIPAGEQIR
jgi:signal transduction histidine kinase